MDPQTSLVSANAYGDPPEFDNKIMLLKTPHIRVLERGEIKVLVLLSLYKVGNINWLKL